MSSFIHHLVWVVLHCSHPSNVISCVIWYGSLHLPSINSYLVYHLVWVVSHLFNPWTLVSVIIWSWIRHLSLSLIRQQLFCTPRTGTPSLVWSINSCFVHHLIWNPSSLLSINGCLVHHLVWIFLHWSYSSTVVSFGMDSFISHSSTVVLYTIWYW